ncbi:Uncharacterised protein [Salmonella enterica subsp. enterica]|uniref:Uncharacterized protein n=1 Tax=Salmonella enterica I TaxID=59201 RepID=A0A379WK22_SALET|nr:Uncharacterised protein [Salmonella enterica subsp. enterica]
MPGGCPERDRRRRRGERRFAGLFVQTHRQRNTLTLQIHFQHFHLHDVASFYHGVWIVDELSRQGRDVDQAILMNADIDKRAEVSDVSDRPSRIIPGSRSFMVSTPSANCAVLIQDAGRGPVFQLFDDIAHGRHAEFIVR